jgi:hypothetical protein
MNEKKNPKHKGKETKSKNIAEVPFIIKRLGIAD